MDQINFIETSLRTDTLNYEITRENLSVQLFNPPHLHANPSRVCQIALLLLAIQLINSIDILNLHRVDIPIP